MEYNFKKVHTSKDLAISIVLIAAGAGLFFVNKALGITIAVCGIFCLLCYKAGFKLEGDSVLLQKSSEDLCKSCKASVLDFLSGKDVMPLVKKGNDGGSVRLDVFYNKAENIAYARLYDFCNYAYEPLTETVELRGLKAEKLISQL